MADFSELLRTAAAQRATETTRPLRDSFTTLRDLLVRYETAVERSAEAEAVSAMLTAIGQAAPPSDSDPPPTAELAQALRQVLLLVEGEPAPVSKMAPEEPAPQPVRPPPPPPRVLGEGDEAAIRRILNEAEEVIQNAGQQHPVRLGILLQALVAEARKYMEYAGPAHPLTQDLSRTIGALAYARKESKVTDFVKGLSRDHRADWGRVAAEARRKLAQYDRDSEAAVPDSRPSTVRRKNESDASPTQEVVELPNVRALLARTGNGVLIVGGQQYRKLPLLAARYAIEAEFVGADGDNPNKTRNLCAKIRQGSFAAVIGLEGFMSHKGWIPLADACRSAGIPLIEGGRGGVGAMDQALAELERRLSQPKAG